MYSLIKSVHYYFQVLLGIIMLPFQAERHQTSLEKDEIDADNKHHIV